MMTTKTKTFTVYRQTVQDPDFGSVLFWATSRAAVVRKAREYCRTHRVSSQLEPPYLQGGVEAVEIPRTKRTLVAWLDEHFTTPGSA